MDSILTSIKTLLSIPEECTDFDNELIVHINSVFMILNQIGIGPEEGYFITSSEQYWSDFLGEAKNVEAVKSYVHLKVRMVFDPPTSSHVLEAMNRQASEYEWRLSISNVTNA